jgi:hypothetical protein
MIRAPQPETVRDYRLRLRRHTFDPVEAKSLRIQITATNGSDTARIYEVRCYA